MRVLISGYYGFANAGDEALLSGMLRALERAGPVEPTVLSADPEGTRRLHGVPALDRRAWGAIWRTLRERTDLFISGGGGLLQDRTSRRSALYYLGMIALAQRAGVPVYLYGQGVGPLASRGLRLVARRVLSGVAGAGARDAASAGLLRALGVPAENVTVTVDPAFALRPSDPAEKAALLEEFGIPWGRRPLLGIVWRSPYVERRRRPERADGDPLRRAVVEAAAAFARAIDARTVVITLQPGVDDAEGNAVAQALADAGGRVHRPAGAVDHRTLRTLVEAMDLNICVRYHGLVFSALGGVPAVALAYDAKVRHLAEELGLPSLSLTGGGKANSAALTAALTDALHGLWREASGISSRLRRRVGALRERALSEAKRCLALGNAAPRRRNGPA